MYSLINSDNARSHVTTTKAAEPCCSMEHGVATDMGLRTAQAPDQVWSKCKIYDGHQRLGWESAKNLILLYLFYVKLQYFLWITWRTAKIILPESFLLLWNYWKIKSEWPHLRLKLPFTVRWFWLVNLQGIPRPSPSSRQLPIILYTWNICF